MMSLIPIDSFTTIIFLKEPFI